MKNIKITFLVFVLLFTVCLNAQHGRRGTYNRDINKVEISGTVIKVSHPIAEIKGTDGKNYEVRLGPIWFWNDNKFSLNEGENVVLNGEVESLNSKNYLYPYTIKQGINELRFADNDGYPLWSRGNGGKGYYGNNRGWCGKGNGRGNNRGYRR